MTCRLSGQSGLSHVVRPSEFISSRRTDTASNDFALTNGRTYPAGSATCEKSLVGSDSAADFFVRRATAFVFAIERGGPFTPDAGNRLIKPVGERAGFLFQVHCHMLRHACGYALANAGQVRAESKTGSGIARYSILALICLPAGHKLETAKASPLPGIERNEPAATAGAGRHRVDRRRRQTPAVGTGAGVRGIAQLYPERIGARTKPRGNHLGSQ